MAKNFEGYFMLSATLHHFGALLKLFRKRQKGSQKTLAEALHLHHNTVGAWERGTVTILSGKEGKARRISLHPDVQRLIQRYLSEVRCPSGIPAIGNDSEEDVRMAIGRAGI